jgi:hypothetical protein
MTARPTAIDPTPPAGSNTANPELPANRGRTFHPRALLARFGKEGTSESVVPRISQETLAEMVGTTRSRVSFFMNRFRKLGFIQYNGELQVHSSLLNVVLLD